TKNSQTASFVELVIIFVLFICQYSGEVLKKAEEHSRHINNIQTSVDLTMFISASEDNTARLFDSASLDHIKTLKTERPLNSAAISLVTCLWEEAMGVTTAFTRIGKFEARSLAGVKGHFGPINCVAFYPDGSIGSTLKDHCAQLVHLHYFGHDLNPRCTY
uniref:Serine-threonine kinase receptor-associated protein n=1 Tax=Cynoglossus semilaevis TaxID=244447 RepID=A0A3P8WXF7_CYNSE